MGLSFEMNFQVVMRLELPTADLADRRVLLVFYFILVPLRFDVVVEGGCSVARNFADLTIPVLTGWFAMVFLFGGGGFAGKCSILLFS